MYVTRISKLLLFFWPVPEIIDPVFAKTSPKHLFPMTETERIGLDFANTGSLNSGTEVISYRDWSRDEYFIKA
jgi:hypothetical protein